MSPAESEIESRQSHKGCQRPSQGEVQMTAISSQDVDQKQSNACQGQAFISNS